MLALIGLGMFALDRYVLQPAIDRFLRWVLARRKK